MTERQSRNKSRAASRNDNGAAEPQQSQSGEPQQNYPNKSGSAANIDNKERC
jgi:hypothetical protein